MRIQFPVSFDDACNIQNNQTAVNDSHLETMMHRRRVHYSIPDCKIDPVRVCGDGAVEINDEDDCLVLDSGCIGEASVDAGVDNMEGSEVVTGSVFVASAIFDEGAVDLNVDDGGSVFF